MKAQSTLYRLILAAMAYAVLHPEKIHGVIAMGMCDILARLDFERQSVYHEIPKAAMTRPCGWTLIWRHCRFENELSHNSPDNDRVWRLAERLSDAGLRVWSDERVIHPGGDIYLAIY